MAHDETSQAQVIRASALMTELSPDSCGVSSSVQRTDAETTGGKMYGLIGKLNAVPGQRDALAAILVDGTQAMPGCLSYIVASDPADDNALWITEVWESQERHKASLSLPAVQAAIAKGRPMIAGFGTRVETVPIGGYG